MIVKVDEKNLRTAAEIHSVSWKAAHRGFCTDDVLENNSKAQSMYRKNGFCPTGKRQPFSGNLSELEMEIQAEKIDLKKAVAILEKGTVLLKCKVKK